MPAKVSV